QHRRLVEVANQLLVVTHDLVQAETGELIAALAQLLDIAVLPRPLGGRDVKPTSSEVVREVLPAPRREPGAVDQHQRKRRLGDRTRHVIASRVVDITNPTRMCAPHRCPRARTCQGGRPNYSAAGPTRVIRYGPYRNTLPRPAASSSNETSSPRYP